ncbi:hypothetical protein BU16DRAFT_568065 [Lophium mytilinum]|uniref:Uncharacterized protein n=1 Tax=Lophium mytilinum TaxID=390894 RepID=A0A6A6Q9W6_9PEZI|nr:hypothetical protein BU16DRAFT_568065 [Lophium mytilinum]
MSVSTLSAAQLLAAVQQITTAPNFAIKNRHLTAAELAALRANPPVWPTAPVFSPFAIRVAGTGTKFLCHRITYAQMHGALGAGLDASHAININPRHLVAETNATNQSRKLCFLFMEEMLWRWEVGLVGAHWWSKTDLKNYLQQLNGACAIIHNHRCECEPSLWEEMD